jgi:prepilin-type N-terminal cleavage/methylation domain-containing protein
MEKHGLMRLPLIQHGFTLIEVLVSLMILSITLLGIDAMEIMIRQQQRDINFQRIANNQLFNMEERLRAVRGELGVAQQLEQWNQENYSVLPGARGEVIENFPYYTVKIYWNEKCIEEKIRVV